jgi:hypothetical protein
MASIERTAYPQFKRNPVVREFVAAYKPNEAEINFVFSQIQQPAHRLTLAILLKAFQRLGYFVPIDRVPPSMVRHIRGTLRLRVQIKPAEVGKNTRYRYHELILAYLQVRPYAECGLDIAACAIRDAVAVMDNPADLINIAIEQLVLDRVELPAFATLDRLARRVRTLVNDRYFELIGSRLTDEEKQQLDGLLVKDRGTLTSPLHAIKRLPKRASLKHFQALLDHIAALDQLVSSAAHLADVPNLKRKHFAAEARALDAAELRDFRPAKRHALLLCLIDRARVQTRDDLAEMYIKRIGNIHNRGKEQLERLRVKYREKTETLVATMGDVIRVLNSHPSDSAAGREIRHLVAARGGIQAIEEDCTALRLTAGTTTCRCCRRSSEVIAPRPYAWSACSICGRPPKIIRSSMPSS